MHFEAAKEGCTSKALEVTVAQLLEMLFDCMNFIQGLTNFYLGRGPGVPWCRYATATP